MKRSEIEIMAPVGSYESLAAAIQAGADAVYFGVGKLNMRAASAANFSLDNLEQIVEKARKARVKTYLTVNTIVYEEEIDDEKPYTIFDPNHTWKRKTVENFRAVRLRTQLFKNGECLYQPRALSAVRAHCLAQVNTLWDEVTRFENPHSYYVDLSQKLWDEKNRLLSQNEF